MISALLGLGLVVASALVHRRARRLSTLLSLIAIAIALWGSVSIGSLTAVCELCLVAAAFSLLSSVVALRRMVFLAAATPHTSVFSTALAVSLLGSGAPALPAMFLASLSLAFLALALARRLGMDVATGIVVSISAVGTIFALQYLASVGVSISSLVVGEAPKHIELSPIAVAAGLLTLCYVPLALPKHLLISVDEDLAKLAGIRVLLHDAVLASLLALVGVATVTSVGFVAQHVLMLVPPAIANALCGSCREGVSTSLVASIASAATGALISIELGVAPAGGVGATLLAYYVASEIVSRVGRRG